MIPLEATETVALSVPLTRPAGTDAVNCVVPTNVVVKGEPFQSSLESGRNPGPKAVIARVEPAPSDCVQPVTVGRICPKAPEESTTAKMSFILLLYLFYLEASYFQFSWAALIRYS